MFASIELFAIFLSRRLWFLVYKSCTCVTRKQNYVFSVVHLLEFVHHPHTYRQVLVRQ